MKKHAYLIASGSLFLLFILFTILVKTVDVAYYYNNTYIGFSTLNYKFGEFASNFGKYESMAKISDVLLYLSFAYTLVLLVFAIIELIKVKSLKKLNRRYYLLLGGLVVMVFFYLLFEIVKVNYSPDSPVGHLKASYPSSHVFLGCMIFLLNSYTATKLLKPEKEWLPILIYMATVVICGLMVFTRTLSTKHWLTDIFASIILVSFLYTLFIYVSRLLVPEGPKEVIETQEAE